MIQWLILFLTCRVCAEAAMCRPSSFNCKERLRSTGLYHRRSEIKVRCRQFHAWARRACRGKAASSTDGDWGTEQIEWLRNLQECKTVAECLGDDSIARSKRQDDDPRAVRKEYRMLTLAERDEFHEAVNRMKTDYVGDRTKYDLFLLHHTAAESPGAHWGPAFLPWHRELLRQFEIALRQYNPDLALPYWDSTIDDRLPDPADSMLWSPAFFGNGFGDVVRGPFANWTVLHRLRNSSRIQRDIGVSPIGRLYSNDYIYGVNQRDSFSNLSHCQDPYFEEVHGGPHNWVGGHCGNIPISPNDPVFYLHHAFVDLIWEEFRETHQSRDERETEWPDTDLCWNTFHDWNATMLPFTSLLNIDGISNRYTDEFYVYAERPSCSPRNTDCGSPYLFCDTAKYECAAKMRPGGNCSHFAHLSPCYATKCINGMCDVDKTTTALPETTAETTSVSETTSVPETTTEVAETTLRPQDVSCRRVVFSDAKLIGFKVTELSNATIAECEERCFEIRRTTACESMSYFTLSSSCILHSYTRHSLPAPWFARAPNVLYMEYQCNERTLELA